VSSTTLSKIIHAQQILSIALTKYSDITKSNYTTHFLIDNLPQHWSQYTYPFRTG